MLSHKSDIGGGSAAPSSLLLQLPPASHSLHLYSLLLFVHLSPLLLLVQEPPLVLYLHYIQYKTPHRLCHILY